MGDRLLTHYRVLTHYRDMFILICPRSLLAHFLSGHIETHTLSPESPSHLLSDWFEGPSPLPHGHRVGENPDRKLDGQAAEGREGTGRGDFLSE